MSTTMVKATEPGSDDVARWMTAEEFLTLPEDEQIERWLLRGKLIKRPLAPRSFPHSRTEASLSHLLLRWLDRQPAPRGLIVSGDAGFHLTRHPDFLVGIDVAYLSAEQLAATPKSASVIAGPPILAVEILSPSDRSGDVTDKIEGYLDAGVKMVWRVEPVLGFVTVFQPDAEPEGLNAHGFLDGGAHLSGFRVSVADLFA